MNGGNRSVGWLSDGLVRSRRQNEALSVSVFRVLCARRISYYTVRTILHAPVHGHSIRPFERCVRGRASRSGIASHREQLLGTESLVVNLASSFDEILEVCAGQEVAKIDKFAVILVFDVNNTPTVLSAANLLPVNDD